MDVESLGEDVAGLAAPYSVFGVVGEGSFGLVLLVKGGGDDAPLRALKCCSSTLTDDAEATASLREVLALQALAEACEDSVVRLHNVLLAGDGVGLELEFLECSLKVAIANRPLPREEQSRVFTGVLCGLRALHARGWVHRDLCPANVLLTDARSAKLADLGSVAEANQFAGAAGDRFYRAPEVLLGLPYGLAADCWSAGALLAEMVTSRPLFPGASVRHMLHLAAALGPIDPAAVAADLGVELAKEVPTIENVGAEPPLRPLAADTASLAARLLVSVPSQRATVEEALGHGFCGPAPALGSAPANERSAPELPKRLSTAAAREQLAALSEALGLMPRAPAPRAPQEAAESRRPYRRPTKQRVKLEGG